MRYKIKVPAHIEEKVICSKTTCDGCCKNIDNNNCYEVNDVTIEARIGDTFPECDSSSLYELDCCGECFLNKIIPALKKIGFIVRKRPTESWSDDGMVFDHSSIRD